MLFYVLSMLKENMCSFFLYRINFEFHLYFYKFIFIIFKEIMKTMLEISEPVYEAYLHELCHLKRWEELHKILKSYRGKLSNSSLQMLARSCSIYTLIEAVDKEETIAELLEIFLEGKNIIIKGLYRNIKR